MASLAQGEPWSPKLRQKAHEDWIITSSLEPLRDGLQNRDFQRIVEQFASEHAVDFTALWPDGSHPLLWTMRHQEYKAIFEEQLEITLATEGMTKETFHSTMQHLQEVRDSLGDFAEDLNGFLTNLTAADDYNTFLQVMFAEVRRQQDSGATLPLPDASQEIEVTVPESGGYFSSGGGHAGQMMMPVDYSGYRYEVAIPAGYGPGNAFKVAVMVPDDN
eukprot:TRINITY_DN77915_c0_g1_i1.p1 TRINITY_DN77915_c0_g1~~TRINITY_DN77915_c0_g1_i1.p1  ORF type:complete len:234 (+),score=62.81 TRINITY_DN77915_c0_g1_i1:49-702(+)